MLARFNDKIEFKVFFEVIILHQHTPCAQIVNTNS